MKKEISPLMQFPIGYGAKKYEIASCYHAFYCVYVMTAEYGRRQTCRAVEHLNVYDESLRQVGELVFSTPAVREYFYSLEALCDINEIDLKEETFEVLYHLARLS